MSKKKKKKKIEEEAEANLRAVAAKDCWPWIEGLPRRRANQSKGPRIQLKVQRGARSYLVISRPASYFYFIPSFPNFLYIFKN